MSIGTSGALKSPPLSPPRVPVVAGFGVLPGSLLSRIPPFSPIASPRGGGALVSFHLREASPIASLELEGAFPIASLELERALLPASSPEIDPEEEFRAPSKLGRVRFSLGDSPVERSASLASAVAFPAESPPEGGYSASSSPIRFLGGGGSALFSPPRFGGGGAGVSTSPARGGAGAESGIVEGVMRPISLTPSRADAPRGAMVVKIPGLLAGRDSFFQIPINKDVLSGSAEHRGAYLRFPAPLTKADKDDLEFYYIVYEDVTAEKNNSFDGATTAKIQAWLDSARAEDLNQDRLEELGQGRKDGLDEASLAKLAIPLQPRPMLLPEKQTVFFVEPESRVIACPTDDGLCVLAAHYERKYGINIIIAKSEESIKKALTGEGIADPYFAVIIANGQGHVVPIICLRKSDGGIQAANFNSIEGLPVCEEQTSDIWRSKYPQLEWFVLRGTRQSDVCGCRTDALVLSKDCLRDLAAKKIKDFQSYLPALTAMDVSGPYYSFALPAQLAKTAQILREVHREGDPLMLTKKAESLSSFLFRYQRPTERITQYHDELGEYGVLAEVRTALVANLYLNYKGKRNLNLLKSLLDNPEIMGISDRKCRFSLQESP